MNYKNEFTKSLIAHRGFYDLSKKIPENSLKAFLRSKRYGYVIELDVHQIKDGNIVVFHDDSLKRACNVDEKIEDLTKKEVDKLRLFNTSCRIPYLKDVLKEINGVVPIIIEIKKSRKNNIEKDLMNVLKDYNGIYAIQSFNLISLYKIKRINKKVNIGLILHTNVKDYNGVKKFIFNKVINNKILKFNFISYNVKKLKDLFFKTQRSDKLYFGWTIKTKNEYEKYKDKCDNLICENMDSY